MMKPEELLASLARRGVQVDVREGRLLAKGADAAAKEVIQRNAAAITAFLLERQKGPAEVGSASPVADEWQREVKEARGGAGWFLAWQCPACYSQWAASMLEIADADAIAVDANLRQWLEEQCSRGRASPHLCLQSAQRISSKK